MKCFKAAGPERDYRRGSYRTSLQVLRPGVSLSRRPIRFILPAGSFDDRKMDKPPAGFVDRVLAGLPR